jgi:sugar lactone lactonase YvrE
MEFSRNVRSNARKYVSAHASASIALLCGMFLSAGVGTVANAQLTPLSFSSVAVGLPAGTGAAVCTGALNSIGDGCPATQAQISTVYESWTDQYNNVYFVDLGSSHELRVLYRGGATLASIITINNSTVTTPQVGYVYGIVGSVTRIAAYSSSSIGKYCNGGTTGPLITDQGGSGCPGYEAYTELTGGLADADGDIFVAEHVNGGMIRVLYAGGAKAAALINVESGGTVTAPVIGSIYRVGGTSGGTQGFGGDGGLATAADMRNPYEVIVDSSENLYFTDSGNNAVRRIDGTTGVITTVAGANCTAGLAGVAPTYGCTAGTSSNGTAATSAELSTPYAVALDASGNLYIADAGNNVVRAIYTAGTLPGITGPTLGAIYTIAGGGTATASGVAATTLHLYAPHTVSFDAAGYLYVASASTSLTIYQIDPTTGIATLFAGGGGTTTVGGYCSGTSGPTATDTVGSGCPATQTKVWPTGRLSFDTNGVAYVADTSSNVIRAFTFQNHFPATAVGSSSTLQVAVTSASSFVAPSISANVQGTTTGEFAGSSIKCTAGTTYAAATVCSYSMQFTPTLPGRRVGEYVLTQSGTAVITQGIVGDGLASLIAIAPVASATTFGSTIAKASSVTVDALGNLYVSDVSTGTLWKLAGTTGTPVALLTGLSQPAQAAVDGLGNVYVADSGNNRIVERTSSGSTLTVLSTGLKAPQGVAVTGSGMLYVADTGNNRVLRYTQGVTSQLPLTGLNIPTAITLDANDNLLISDTGNQQVVSFAGGIQSAVSFGAAKVNASGLATDAAGDIYIADKLTDNVLRMAAGSSAAISLASGLSSPGGISIDGYGDVFYTDSAVAGLSEAVQQHGSVVFPNTNQGDTSAAVTITVANIGNAALTFLSSPGYAVSGNTADFGINAGSSGCGTATIASASVCTLAAVFQPVSTNSYAEAVTLQTNAVNTSTAVANLSGQGVNLIHTTTTLSYSPSSVVYGNTINFTVTVAPASGTVSPSGNVTVSVDGIPYPTLTLNNASATFMASLSTGIHVVVATYQGNTNFLSSTGTVSLTVAPQPTSTTLTVSFSPNTDVLTLTATVLPSISGQPAGTVNFLSGTSVIGSATLNNGVATYSVANAVYTSSSFTAQYTGAPNYAGSTSMSVALTSTFGMAPATPALTTVAGLPVTTTLTLTSYFGYSGSLTFACAGLPQNAVCRFQPTTVALTPGSSVLLTLEVFTNVSPGAQTGGIAGGGYGRWLMFLSVLSSLLLLRNQALMRRRFGYRLLPIVLLLPVLSAIAGCGNGSTAFNPTVTPVGVSTFTVKGTDRAGNSQTATYTLAVTKS